MSFRIDLSSDDHLLVAAGAGAGAAATTRGTLAGMNQSEKAQVSGVRFAIRESIRRHWSPVGTAHKASEALATAHS